MQELIVTMGVAIIILIPLYLLFKWLEDLEVPEIKVPQPEPEEDTTLEHKRLIEELEFWTFQRHLAKTAEEFFVVDEQRRLVIKELTYINTMI